MTTVNRGKIIIQGINAEGEHFRPSDWADRMCGSLATFRGRRIHYDPRLMPMTTEAGIKCVEMDHQLRKEHAPLYESILDFAQKNKLCVTYQDDSDAATTNTDNH